MNIQKKLLFLCLCFFFAITGKGNITQKEFDDVLIRISEIQIQYPDSALGLIEEMFRTIESENNPPMMAALYFNKGKIVKYTNADQALIYLFEAKKIYEDIQCKRGRANIYGTLGIMDNIEANKRLSFLKNALKLYKELSNETGMSEKDISGMYNNIGAFFIGNDMVDSAQFYLLEGLKYARSVNYKSAVALATYNLGKIEMSLGFYHSALNFYREALNALPPEDKLYSLPIKHGLINSFLKIGWPDSAFHYYHEIENDIYLRPDVQRGTFQVFAEYYRSSKDFEKALQYTNKADSVKDVINARSDKNKLAILEMESASRLKEAELKSLNAKMEKSRVMRIFLALMLLLTVFLLYQQWQKGKRRREIILQKHKRMETEQKLMEAELKNSEIERQYLNDELNYTNKELTSFATNIVQNHTLLNELRTRINMITRESSIHKMKDDLREVNTMLLQVFNNNEQRKEFIEKSRQLNHSLIYYLKTQYQNLTESDINLLILLMLKFTAKDVAALYNIETMSAKKKRYRLRKKLGLNDEDTMEEFFDKLMEDARLKFAG